MRMMMVGISLGMFSTLTGCATSPDVLRAADGCRVWQDDTFNQEHAEVENGVAAVKAGCITGDFLCKTKKTYFKGDEIHTEGELTPFRGKIGTFRDGKLSLAPPRLVAGAFPASTIEILGDEVRIAQKVLGRDRTVTYYYNSRCSKPDVALGTAVLFFSR